MPGCRGMVERLAESLRERNTLLLSPGYAPTYAEATRDADALRAVHEALDVLQGHGPYSAMIVTGGASWWQRVRELFRRICRLLLPGAPRGIRTPDLLLRRQLLYPLS